MVTAHNMLEAIIGVHTCIATALSRKFSLRLCSLRLHPFIPSWVITPPRIRTLLHVSCLDAVFIPRKMASLERT